MTNPLLLASKIKIENDLKELKEKNIEDNFLRGLYKESNLIYYDIISLLNRLENQKKKNNELIDVLNKYRTEYDKRELLDLANERIERNKKDNSLLLDNLYSFYHFNYTVRE